MTASSDGVRANESAAPDSMSGMSAKGLIADRRLTTSSGPPGGTERRRERGWEGRLAGRSGHVQMLPRGKVRRAAAGVGLGGAPASRHAGGGREGARGGSPRGRNPAGPGAP